MYTEISRFAKTIDSLLVAFAENKFEESFMSYHKPEITIYEEEVKYELEMNDECFCHCSMGGSRVCYQPTSSGIAATN